MMKNGEGALMRRITEVSFALDELRLFLDTHPDCTEALNTFAIKEEKREQLLDEYARKYGGVEGYRPGTENGWEWNTAPMPWKKEANG